MDNWRNNSNNTKAAGRWHKLAHDVGIYALGNLGAKVITFAMVPLYTYCIPQTDEFGYFDLCLTTIFLVSVLATLDLRDGMFRQLLDGDQRQSQQVLNAGYRLVGMSLLATLVMSAVVLWLYPIAMSGLVVALLISVSVFDVYSQVVRGLGHNQVFAAMGVASALLIAVFSVLLVFLLDWGVAGVFVANIAARLLPAAVVEARLHTLANISHRVPWRDTARQLLRYSLPLVPVMITWWLLSSSDRWFVLWGAGQKANGIYAVAARFTGVIYTFAVILQQAWQETAILQYKSADRNRFFTQIFTAFVYVLTGVLLAYITVLKCCYGWLVEENYHSGLPLLFPMGVAALVFSLGIFLDMGYQCSQQTARAMPSSVATAILNIVLNLFLAPRWGMWGVVTASLVAFCFYSTYRWVDTRRYFRLTPGWRMAAPLAAIAATGAAFYCSRWWWVDASAAIAGFALLWMTLPAPVRKVFPLWRGAKSLHKQ